MDNKKSEKLGKLYFHARSGEWFRELASGSTFLVPKSLQGFLEGKISEHRGLRNYLTVVLEKYVPYLESGRLLVSFGGCHQVTQGDGLELRRLDFRPKVNDWCEMKFFSQGFHASMCYLFVFLLEIEAGVKELDNCLKPEPRRSTAYNKDFGVGYPDDKPAVRYFQMLLVTPKGSKKGCVIRKTSRYRRKYPKEKPKIG